MNKIPRNIFVFIIANISNPLESFIANIWVSIKIIAIKTPNNSRENTPMDDEITKNQKDKPALTASALNLGDDNSILNRIDKRY